MEAVACPTRITFVCAAFKGDEGGGASIEFNIVLFFLIFFFFCFIFWFAICFDFWGWFYRQILNTYANVVFPNQFSSQQRQCLGGIGPDPHVCQRWGWEAWVPSASAALSLSMRLVAETVRQRERKRQSERERRNEWAEWFEWLATWTSYSSDSIESEKGRLDKWAQHRINRSTLTLQIYYLIMYISYVHNSIWTTYLTYYTIQIQYTNKQILYNILISF